MKRYLSKNNNNLVAKWKLTGLLDDLSIRDKVVVAEYLEETAEHCLREVEKDSCEFTEFIIPVVRTIYNKTDKMKIDYELAKELYNEIRPKFIEMIKDNSYCWNDAEFEFMSMFADMYINKHKEKYNKEL